MLSYTMRTLLPSFKVNVWPRHARTAGAPPPLNGSRGSCKSTTLSSVPRAASTRCRIVPCRLSLLG
jgi:hypothetical protein